MFIIFFDHYPVGILIRPAGAFKIYRRRYGTHPPIFPSHSYPLLSILFFPSFSLFLLLFSPLSFPIFFSHSHSLSGLASSHPSLLATAVVHANGPFKGLFIVAGKLWKWFRREKRDPKLATCSSGARGLGDRARGCFLFRGGYTLKVGG